MMNEILFEHTLPNDRRLVLVRGDLCAEQVDAIVNAANESLAHGGGVAGAIVRAGGASIQEESTPLAPIPTGQAVRTSAGRLPARAVIHAVGPRMGMGAEDELLASAVRSALAIAAAGGDRTLSMPAISSGIFGFPKERCARILIGESQRHLEEDETSLEEIRFCLIDEPTCEVFLAQMRERYT